jgi:hypothetical protein
VTLHTCMNAGYVLHTMEVVEKVPF